MSQPSLCILSASPTFWKKDEWAQYCCLSIWIIETINLVQQALTAPSCDRVHDKTHTHTYIALLAGASDSKVSRTAKVADYAIPY